MVFVCRFGIEIFARVVAVRVAGNKEIIAFVQIFLVGIQRGGNGINTVFGFGAMRTFSVYRNSERI